MPDLRDVAEIAAANGHLAIVSTVRADGTIQASLVSAGVTRHPLTGQEVLGFVAVGGVKVVNLRARPELTATLHHGWKWITVEGSTELAGPDDSQLGLIQSRLAGLLRTIFTDAGGTHDDWPTYDRTMARERRTAVLVQPTRIYSNPHI